ncbi:MAG TPA: DUF4331 domain-containing protein, partial [Acidimicrobiia bacterium]|nr:DUF4331 domain-containing protein [Acidimicrobiia bacterium]
GTEQTGGECLGTTTCGSGTTLSGTTCMLPEVTEVPTGQPLSGEDRLAEPSDIYLFTSPDVAGTVTLIANFIPLEEPAVGPNFYGFSPSVLYELKIDNDGDAVEDIIYQFRFRTVVGVTTSALYAYGLINNINDSDFGVKQFYDVTRVDIDNANNRTTTSVAMNVKVPPARVGPRTSGNQAAYEAVAAEAITATNVNIGGLNNIHKMFAGPRDDPSFADQGALHDLLNIQRINNLASDPNAQVSIDMHAGFNVHSIALQVPVRALTSDFQVPTNADAPNAVIGMWTTTSRPELTVRSATARPTVSANWIQVARLGLPFVRDIETSYANKDARDRGAPSTDTAFTTAIMDPEHPKLWNALYGLSIPSAPRNDLRAFVGFFYTPTGTVLAGTGTGFTKQPVIPADILHLNLATPATPIGSGNRLGFLAGDNNGFPNGRRLGDDVVDIMERVLVGVLVNGFNVTPNNILNDGVIQNDVAFSTTFPFLGTPHEAFLRIHQ